MGEPPRERGARVATGNFQLEVFRRNQSRRPVECRCRAARRRGAASAEPGATARASEPSQPGDSCASTSPKHLRRLGGDALGRAAPERQAAAGDVHQDAAPVARVGLAVDEVVGDQRRRPGASRGPQELRVLGQLGHAVALAARQQRQRPPALDGAVVCARTWARRRVTRRSASLRASTSASPSAAVLRVLRPATCERVAPASMDRQSTSRSSSRCKAHRASSAPPANCAPGSPPKR